MAGSLIAVVNDDTTFLDLMHDLLTDEGFRVIRLFARDGALPTLERERPALVLLDIRMEEPDAGLLLLREVRASQTLGNVPVIVCTADQRFLQMHRETLNALRVQTLSKPFDLDALLAKITALLDAPPAAMCG